MKNLILSSVVLLLISLGGQADDYGDPEARKIVEEVIREYTSLKTYKSLIRAEMVMTMGNVDNMFTREYQLYIQKPNKFALLARNMDRSQEIYSNGEQKWTYLTHLNQYTLEEAPENFLDSLKANLDSPAYLSSGQFLLFKFFEQEPDFLNSDDLTMELTGEEVIDGISNKIINVRFEDINLKLWIHSQKKIITKIEADIKNIIEERHKDMIAEKVKMRYTEFHENIEVDSEIKEDLFEFQPDEELEKTEEFFAREFMDGTDIYAGNNYRDFEFLPYGSDKVKNIADYLDKPLVLFFIDPEAQDSENIFRNLEKIKEEYSTVDLNFIIISEYMESNLIEKFIAEDEHNIVFGEDRSHAIKELYQINTFPTGFLIDIKGKITQVYTGYFPGLIRQIFRDINLFISSGREEIPGDNEGVYQLWNIPADVIHLTGGEIIEAIISPGNILRVGKKGNIESLLKVNRRFDRLHKFYPTGEPRQNYLIYKRGERNLNAIDSTGKQLWQTKIIPSVNDLAVPENFYDREQFVVGTGGQEGVYILNSTGSIISKSSSVVNVTHIYYSNEEENLVALSNDGRLYLLTGRGELIEEIESSLYIDFMKVIRGEEEIIVLSGSDGNNEILKILDRDYNIIWEVILGPIFKSGIYDLQSDPDNNLLAVSTYDGHIYIFDRTGQETGHIKGEQNKLSIGWLTTESGKNIVTGNFNQGISCYGLLQ